MKKIYAYIIYSVNIVYNIFDLILHYLFHEGIRWDVFNYTGWLIFLVGAFCFFSAINHKYKLYLSTLAFFILPTYALYKLASMYVIFLEVYSLKQHLLMWLSISIHISLVGVYLYFKNFVSDVRPVWYFLSRTYIVRSVKGKESIPLTIFWLGPFLSLLFLFLVYKPLRYMLSQYGIGIFYTYAMMSALVLFFGFWLISIYRSTRS